MQRLTEQRFPDAATIPARDRIRPWDRPVTLASTVETDVAVSQAARAGVGRRQVLVAAGFTAAAVAGSVVAVKALTSSRNGSNETLPSLSYRPLAGVRPADLLNSLAERASQQPPPPGTGPLLYTAQHIWTLVPGRDASGDYLGMKVTEYKQETWLAPDGSGRFLRVEQNPAGGFPFTMDHPLPVPPSAPPEVEQPNPDALRAWMLRQGHDWTTADWFRSTDRWKRIADPTVAAVLLRILATRPNITVDGSTTTRGGRPAVSVSTTMAAKPDGPPPQTRLHMLLDHETGLLLGTETVALTADAIGGSVVPPATVGATAWEKSAFVAKSTVRPGP